MKNLSGGRFIYAVGTDAEAARLAGIDPKRTTFGVFVLMGALTGLAAVMNLVQSPQVQPTCGDGLELKVIAAAVVGGVAISGGRGTLWGVLLGLLLLANVNPALTHFHQPPYWEKAIQGLVILLAVMADGLRNRKQTPEPHHDFQLSMKSSLARHETVLLLVIVLEVILFNAARPAFPHRRKHFQHLPPFGGDRPARARHDADHSHRRHRSIRRLDDGPVRGAVRHDGEKRSGLIRGSPGLWRSPSARSAAD